jgi:hypothetical protein
MDSCSAARLNAAAPSALPLARAIAEGPNRPGGSAARVRACGGVASSTCSTRRRRSCAAVFPDGDSSAACSAYASASGKQPAFAIVTALFSHAVHASSSSSRALSSALSEPSRSPAAPRRAPSAIHSEAVLATPGEAPPRRAAMRSRTRARLPGSSPRVARRSYEAIASAVRPRSASQRARFIQGAGFCGASSIALRAASSASAGRPSSRRQADLLLHAVSSVGVRALARSWQARASVKRLSLKRT